MKINIINILMTMFTGAIAVSIILMLIAVLILPVYLALTNCPSYLWLYTPIGLIILFLIGKDIRNHG